MRSRFRVHVVLKAATDAGAGRRAADSQRASTLASESVGGRYLKGPKYPNIEYLCFQ